MLFLDVETQNFFSDAADGESYDSGDLKISFVGAYDDQKGEFMSFWEKDMGKLEGVMKEAERVVGYNSWAFDYGVMSSYMETDVWSLPSLDLMVAMKKIVGFRPKLDDLGRANGIGGKIGKGADAVEYWKKGELDKLEKYCLEDVRLTYEVWRVGEEEGKLKYYDQSGFLQETQVGWEDGYLQRLDESVQGRLL